MVKFEKANFEYHGGYLHYNHNGERKFVARFKHRGPVNKAKFLAVLKKHYSVDEYFAKIAAGRARIAKAEGEAKATQIEAEALRTNPAILQQKWIDKWNGQLPTYVAGGNSGMMLSVPKK